MYFVFYLNLIVTVVLDPAGLRTAQDQSGLNLESDHYFQLSSFEISTCMEGREELQFISNYASFTIVKFLKIMHTGTFNQKYSHVAMIWQN